MKKQLTLIISIITAISLCGCETKLPDSSRDSSVENSAGSSTAEGTADSTSESIPNNSAPEETTEKGEPLVLIGPDGNTVPEEDYISALGLEWKEIPTTGLTTENFNRVEVEGAYVMMPTGCRTANDHADVFDSENNVFTDLLPQHKTEFIRVKAGDEICGFKVRSAVSDFVSQDYYGDLYTDPKTGNKVYFDGNRLELEGEIELTGYLCVIVGGRTFWSTGDIRFVPADREVNLPVIDYEFDPDEGFYHSVGEHIPSEGEPLRFANEYGAIKLVPSDVDTSSIPDEGSWVKARVKLNNISMSCSTYAIPMSAVFADITELTIL
ncbi:MAG: hypothetical protein J1F28_08040 [Oscillospiraceae bacterium]|nr:hypothetical protein [Oscillospiraceae bacterium]